MTEQQSAPRDLDYDHFFESGEVRPEFRKEYISLWSGWLGKERLHLMDEVTEREWSRFNRMLIATFEAFRMGVVDHTAGAIEYPSNVGPFLCDYKSAMQKDGSQFLQFVIPALDCVLTEEWDYTYILWHRSTDAVKAFEPLLGSANLEHFSE